MLHGAGASLPSSAKSGADATTSAKSIGRWSTSALPRTDAFAEGSARALLLRHTSSTEASYRQKVRMPGPAMLPAPNTAPVASLAPPKMTHATGSTAFGNAQAPAPTLQNMCTFPPKCVPSYDYNIGETVEVCIYQPPEPRVWGGMCQRDAVLLIALAATFGPLLLAIFGSLLYCCWMELKRCKQQELASLTTTALAAAAA